jgi:hypothetical protein
MIGEAAGSSKRSADATGHGGPALRSEDSASRLNRMLLS